MKRSAFLILFQLSLGLLSAEILAPVYAPEPFDEDSYVIYFDENRLDILEPTENYSQSYDFALRSKDSEFELRYILFRQTGEVASLEDLKFQAYVWASMVIANITGSEPTDQNTTAYLDSDVENEFNGDFGLTSFSMDIQTDYSDDYPFVMINFYARQGLGMMCQTIHFKDLSWIATEDFNIWFHGFQFY